MSFDEFLQDGAYRRWFWSGNNANQTIDYLNDYRRWNDRLRRERYSPHVYVMVLNKPEREFWKLLKVGFTERDTRHRRIQK